MEMEMMVPVHNMDFDFNSARNSPYPTAPSTPKGFGAYYYSAPPSPSRVTELYSEIDDFYDINFDIASHSSSSDHVSFDHFKFDVKEVVEGELIASADNLFDKGMIKPLITPSLLPKEIGHGESSSQKSKITSSHGKKKEIDYSTHDSQSQTTIKLKSERERGRERVQNISSSSKRATRSLSPTRVHKYSGDQQEKDQKQLSIVEKSSSSSKSQKKWRFKDLFLFRNASDGRASEKDLLKKYTAQRANERPPLIPRKKGPVSAHELLYTENRAAREEEKKKSYLPYKGFWGGKPFNARLANGLGFNH